MQFTWVPNTSLGMVRHVIGNVYVNVFSCVARYARENNKDKEISKNIVNKCKRKENSKG